MSVLHTLQCTLYWTFSIRHFMDENKLASRIVCSGDGSGSGADIRFDDMCPLHWNFHDFWWFIGRLRLCRPSLRHHLGSCTQRLENNCENGNIWGISTGCTLFTPISLVFRFSSFSSFDGFAINRELLPFCLPKTDGESSSINCSRQAHSLTGWFSPMAFRVCVLCGMPMEPKRRHQGWRCTLWADGRKRKKVSHTQQTKHCRRLYLFYFIYSFLLF